MARKDENDELLNTLAQIAGYGDDDDDDTDVSDIEIADVEISGDDNDDDDDDGVSGDDAAEIGRKLLKVFKKNPAQITPAMKKAAQAALTKLKQQKGPPMRDPRNPTIKKKVEDGKVFTRYYGLRRDTGINGGLVPAGGQVELEVEPATEYRAEHLWVNDSDAPHFSIVKITMGPDNELIPDQPVPAVIFAASNSGDGKYLKTPTVQARQKIKVTILNHDVVDRPFRGGLTGYGIRPA